MRLRVPPTLLFGSGQLAELPQVLEELAAERPLLVTDPGVAATGLPERLCAALTRVGHPADVWDGAAPDPDEGHVERCCERLKAGGHRSVIALGGGSVMDVAKVAAALATCGGKTSDYFGFDKVRQPGLPLLTIPTTPGSGAEVSSHAVIMQLAPRKKEVVGGFHLMPKAAVVDPDAIASLPPRQTSWSALDGFIHAVESFLARRATLFTDTYARQAVPLIVRSLPRVLADREDKAAREDLSLGCLYSGLAMANANAGAIHALGYPLTGRYGIPHGLANAIMAAAALERIAPRRPGRPDRGTELACLIGEGLGGPPPADLADGVRRFLATVGIAERLSGWGIQESDLPDLAEAATHFKPVLQNTPVAFDQNDLLEIYRATWA